MISLNNSGPILNRDIYKEMQKRYEDLAGPAMYPAIISPGHQHNLNDPGHSHTVGSPSGGPFTKAHYMKLLAMRLRMKEGEAFPFQHIDFYIDNTKELAFIFVVSSDKPVILEDNVALFPSDQLVSALHLLKK